MKSLDLARLLFVTSAVLLPVTAGGQTVAPRAGSVAPAPRPPQVAPSPTSMPTPPPPVAPAPGGAGPKSAPLKVRVPANLLKLKDTEIIFVGGKQTTAGEVKRDLRAQILRQAGAPKLVRVASRKSPGPSKMPLTAEAAALLSRQAGRVAPAIVDCTQQGPTILGVQGAVASGQQFTLIGRCFGEKSGDVKLIGQFPGGNIHSSSDPLHPGVGFGHWDQGHITVILPAISGAPDHPVAISVTTEDKRESPARQANFVAARTRVEVPAGLWTPTAHFESTWNDVGEHEVNPFAQSPTTLVATVNPACALDNLEVTAHDGKVTGVTGWPDGPPNVGTVQVAWEAMHYTVSYWYTAIDDDYSAASFDVKAWANCPVGVAP